MDDVKVIIDWVSLTVHDSSHYEIIKMLGLDLTNFKQTQPRLSYQYAVGFEDIVITWGGNAGTHLIMSGDGCRAFELLSHRTFSEFFQLLFDGYERVNFTRIDLAIDDKRALGKNNSLKLTTLAKKISKGECDTKIKNYDHIKGNQGETLYIGSRESETFYRFYDKRAQVIKKNKGEMDELPNNWIRYEIEIKGKKANELANIIASEEMEVGAIAFGILKESLRFVKKRDDETPVKECETWRPWASFLREVQPLKLSSEKKESTIEDMRRWFDTLARAVYIMREAYGLNYIWELSEKGKDKLSEIDRENLANFKADYLEDYQRMSEDHYFNNRLNLQDI